MRTRKKKKVTPRYKWDPPRGELLYSIKLVDLGLSQSTGEIHQDLEHYRQKLVEHNQQLEY